LPGFGLYEMVKICNLLHIT